MKLIAKTSFGFEPLLVDELKAIGATNIVAGTRAVTFEGDLGVLYKANLHSRTALRILKPVRSFKAAGEQQLYNEIKKIDWSRYISATDTLAVDAVVHHSKMTHSLYVAQKTKDAIVDQFRENTGKRPDVDLANPSLKIHVHITADQAEVSLDSSGAALYKRGYRQQGGEAPLNETLAAGMILLSQWDRQSPFVDLMCGSGTLMIEAAMLALNIAPGINRNFGFERWRDFDAQLLRRLKSEAAQSVKEKLDFPITGIDQSSFAIRAAKENAEAAGVDKYIDFIYSPFESYEPQADHGTLITNPPYGERLDPENLFSLYKTIGDTLKKKFTGWDAFIFTANKEASKHIGLRPSRKIPLYNGQLECRLFKFEMYSGSKKNRATTNV